MISYHKGFYGFLIQKKNHKIHFKLLWLQTKTCYYIKDWISFETWKTLKSFLELYLHKNSFLGTKTAFFVTFLNLNSGFTVVSYSLKQNNTFQQNLQQHHQITFLPKGFRDFPCKNNLKTTSSTHSCKNINSTCMILKYFHHTKNWLFFIFHNFSRLQLLRKKTNCM